MFNSRGTGVPSGLVALAIVATAGAFELDDSRAGQDATVEADVVRSQAGRQACRVKHLGVEPGDLEKQPASRLVPVEREEAVNLLHPGRSFFD